MSTWEKTYSFRASADLGERMESLRETLSGVAELSSVGELPDWLARELELGVLRRWEGLVREAPSQSMLMRAAVETLVDALERVLEDLRLVEEYREWAREDAREADAVRAGALEAAAERWGDE